MSEGLWQLPTSWAWAPIRELGEVVSGGTPSTKEAAFWGEDVVWFSPADLTGYSAKYIRRGAKSLSDMGLRNCSARVMPAGSVMFSSRAPIGYIAINAVDAATNQGFKSVVPGATLFNEYLYYYLKASKQVAEERATGTTFKEISGSAFSLLPVPVAPIREQHRIVAKIEEFFSGLDEAVESLTRARAQLKTYRHALLDAAADGRFLIWVGERDEPFARGDKCPLSDLVEELGQGWSPQCLNHPASSDEDWSVIKTTAIQHLSFDDQENKALPSGLAPRPHLELRPGDLLVTRAGPRSRVGVACLVRQVRPRLMLCDKAYRLRVDEAHILPDFLELVLNSPRVLSEIEKLKTGINDSGVNLTQTKFLALRVPAPPIDEQRRTLAQLSDVLSKVDQLENEICTAVAKTNALRESILKNAFSGKLAPQDPTDEPAAALIARLREVTPAPRSRRRKSA